MVFSEFDITTVAGIMCRLVVMIDLISIDLSRCGLLSIMSFILFISSFGFIGRSFVKDNFLIFIFVICSITLSCILLKYYVTSMRCNVIFAMRYILVVRG